MMKWALDLLVQLQHLREMLGDNGVYVMNLISEYGLTYIIALPMLVYWCFDKLAGYKIMLVILGGNTMNHLVKLTACIERPWILDKRITPPEIAIKNQGGYSFPSGHTQIATAYLGGTAHWLKDRHKVLSILLWIMAFVVAFSRMFLGVHTIFDIIGGILESAVMIIVADKVFAYAWKSEKNLKNTVLLGLLVSVLAVLYIMFKPYPIHYYPDGTMMTNPQDMVIYNAMGGLAGLFIGLWIEQKYIRFRIDVTAKQKVLRFLVGGILYYLINKYVPDACLKYMGIWPGSFIYNFIQLMFPTAMYPFLFSHISFLGSGQEASRVSAESSAMSQKS